MRIKLTSLYVDDQNRARAFYTDVLGMQVKTDAAYSEGVRWLSPVSPDDPEGTELVLELPDEPAPVFQPARREAGRPATALTTGDCEAETERLKAAGVRFVMEPTRLPYGGSDAVFDDTCGNPICTHQD